MQTEKVIQNVEKRYPGRFCEKGTSIRDDIFKGNVRHRKDAK